MHRTHFRWTGCAIAGTALILAATAAACGSSAGAATVAPERWRTSVCGAVRTYGRKLDRDYRPLDGVALEFKYGIPRRSDVRAKESAAIEALIEDTHALRERVDRAGIPRFEHGAEYRAELLGALDELEHRLDDLHSKAEALPGGDDRAPADALLTPVVQKAFTSVGTRMAKARERYPAAQAYECA